MADNQPQSNPASLQAPETPQAQENSLPQEISQSLLESQELPSSEYEGDEEAEAHEALAKAAKEASEALEAESSESNETGDAKGIPEERQPEDRSTEDASPASDSADKVKPSALASFHRQLKEHQAKVQAFKAEKAELDKFKSAIENAKVDRLAALEMMGYTDVKTFLESIVEDGGRMTPERQELQKLKKWREEQETQNKKQQEEFQAQQQQRAVQAKLDEIHGQVQNTLKSEAFTGRLINLEGSDVQVMQEMDRMATETGEIPKIEDAIERVEKQFRSNLEVMAKNPMILDYFREKLHSTKSEATVPSQSKTRGTSKTIGSQARSPGLRRSADNGPSDDGEREMAEAMAFLKSAGV
jgi:hypothetical protein